MKALNAFAAKAEPGVVEKFTNTKTGIRQYDDKNNPTLSYNSAGNPFVYDSKTKLPAAYRVFGIVTVNKFGPFFDKFNKVKAGNYDSGFIRSQVLQILHELAHVVLDEKGHPLIVDDGSKNKDGSITTSENNTEIVKTACQKEIEASGLK